MKFDDLTLIRYVEHDLDEVEALEVEQFLKDDEPAREKVEMLQGTSSVLKASFGTLKDAKPPETLIRKIQELEQKPKIATFTNTNWYKIAATLVLGIFVGGIGSQVLNAPEDALVFRNGSSLRQYFKPNVIAKVFDAGADGQSIKLEVTEGKFLRVKIWQSLEISDGRDCRLAIVGWERKKFVYSLGITACKPRNKLWSEAQVDFEEL